MPNGIPMIVMNCAIAVMMCPSANHQPATMNQITLPMPDATPAEADNSGDGVAKRQQHSAEDEPDDVQQYPHTPIIGHAVNGRAPCTGRS